MQGFIHLLLESYVSETIGSQHLRQIRRMAGINGPPLAAQHYPDQVTTQLLQAISEYQQVALDDLLYQFGVYFMNAPLMHTQYRVFLEGHASARSLLDYVPMIHHQLGKSLPSASLPELRYVDHAPDLLEIIYDSPRRLCRFLQGILAGVGLYFHETLEIREVECQHRGAPACRILVRFAPASPSSRAASHPAHTGAAWVGSQNMAGGTPSQPFALSADAASLEARRQRDEQEDVFVLHTLASSQAASSHPLQPGNQPEPPLAVALTLFEIARWLTAQGASAEHTRLSQIQRSLSRLTVEGFVESKMDPQAARPSGSSSAAALAGQGILAARRYRITTAGQAWLHDMQQQRQGY